jgi:hypothetical protein
MISNEKKELFMSILGGKFSAAPYIMPDRGVP